VTRLQDKWSRVQIPAVARDSAPLQIVQPGSETHPSNYSLGTVGSFPGSKMAWVLKLTTHCHYFKAVHPCCILSTVTVVVEERGIIHQSKHSIYSHL